MNMAFTSNPDKQISFSDCLNDLMVDGNMFRGTYEGAYVTYIRGVDLPIAYFGKGYDSSTTVAHEFGHYMNEIYNDDEYSQSFDLLETHSQGQEMLYIQYAKNYLEGDALELVETYHLLSTIQTIMLATQVTCFEQAIYLDHYEGPNSDVIMADGTITADEYDDVYAGLSEYLGIDEANRVDEYWRYVTISSPCYYISYAVSGVNALQIYVDVMIKGYDVAKDSYLKLFTYTDVDPEMTLEQILTHAGLTSYVDEQTFVRIKNLLG
jgi:oligoendopeptidase F